MRIVVIGAALGEVHLRFGMYSMDLAHHDRLANVSVPRDGIGVAAEIGIVEFGDDPAPINIIVVENPNLRWRVRLFEQRPEMLADEFGLALLRPDARGHLAVLVG